MIYPDKIIRSKRKTLSVCVGAGGTLVVRAPLRCSDERIFSFLEKKRKWIEEKQAKARTRTVVTTPSNLHGFRFPLLGMQATVCLYEGSRVVPNPQTGVLFVPRIDAEKKLVKYLKTTAKGVLSRLAEEYAKRMKTSYPTLTVTSARTRWGSCSWNNSLHFSFRLAFAPQEVIEYVVVHELCHTFHKNHGEAFWKKVEAYIPDYKQKLAFLTEHSWFMQLFEKRRLKGLPVVV